ncbi:FHA domain-containing protein [Parabacteroides pacaensis]|uniref:FHA domain-containing protein n=1 Tax=Parabacteroides pacaensis TaxID=2086575 RepID=UPI000D0EEE0D|nr:FHA domain-containing protein [Parabacteroides pacaensis]
MSSNKTIIPGMENAYTEHSPNFGKPGIQAQDGTCIPNPFGTEPTSMPNQKPVVGFLYSISKSSSGEFWPLRIGSNSIGRSTDCDVCLSEATVSEQHAVLVVRQMKNPEKIIASICDARSTCGTMINGESLGFNQRECFNGDIITIGEHYDLFFILIDAKQIGLNVCREFIPTQSTVHGYNRQHSNSNPYAAPSVNHFTQNYEVENTDPQSGTVGFDESENKPATKSGGTIFM